VHDLDTLLERLAADATRDAVAPEVEAIARRGRRRRRRQLAGSAALVAAVVAAGLVVPARLAGRSSLDRPLPATAPATDVTGAAGIGGYWFGKTDASVFLGGGATSAEREAVRRRLKALPVVDRVYYESPAEALARFKERYRTRPELSRKITITASGMPESFRVRLDAPEDFRRLQRAFCPGPVRSPTRHAGCLDHVEVVEDAALVKQLLVPEPWATSADLSVFLPTGTTDAERQAVRARLEAIDGVAGVAYESPAEAYRRLPAWPHRKGADPATLTPQYPPETMRGAFRVTLSQPGRVREFHLALCGSRTTGKCAGGLVVLEHPRKQG
jgi:cell division protein FtsX